VKPTRTGSERVRAKSFVLELGAAPERERSSAAAPPKAHARPATLAKAELERLALTVERATASVDRPMGALYFHSGPPSWSGAIADVIAAVTKLPGVVVQASGVLTEQGELETAPALSGIVWGGSSVEVGVADDPNELEAQLSAKGALLLFAAAEGFDSATLARVAARHRVCFGAGAPACEVYALRAGVPAKGKVAALRLGQAPVVDQAAACKLASEPMVITEMTGELVTRLDGRPALDVLREKAGGGKHGGGLVLVALFENGHDDRFLVRPLRGIDTDRRGLAIAARLREGETIGFAVRDSLAARAALEASVRRVEQAAQGAAPSFALFLSCAGRGRSLYGAVDVDLRLLKHRYPAIPIAGMHSSFELVPWGEGQVRLQLMTGLTALFTMPS
jgi:small ligand-binding sensory domain FIST